MIRPITCICLILAAASGLYMYQIKHRTLMLDRRIEQTLAESEAVHDRIRLLNAEWAVLNDPNRLRDLAAKFLNLRPIAPSQFVTMAELDKHLPAVRTYAPSGSAVPEAPQDEPAIQVQAGLEPVPMPPPPATMSAEARLPEPAPPSRTAFAERREPPAHSAPETAPRREPTAHPAIGAVPGPLATPVSNPVILNPVLSRVMATNQRPPAAHESTGRAAAYAAAPPATRVTAPAVTATASVLGNPRGGLTAVSLAPPVPVAAGSSAPFAGLR